jgi:DNA adenine methylase
MSENQKTARPFLRWPGGKRRMLKLILPRIPKHVCYCEPFIGGGAVLFAKECSPVEVINDFNDTLIALYRNLQFHLPALETELDWFIASRKNLHDFIAQPGLTEIQRATRYLLVNRTSFGGNMHSFGVAKTNSGGVGFRRDIIKAALGSARERLNGVVIENTPYERCLQNYDSTDSFFFLDPPYLNCQQAAYSSWSEADMRQFRKRVEKLRGKWIVTVDDSAFNRELFADCKVERVVTRNRLTNNRTHAGATFGELLIEPK